jgi:hypothetical protein
MTTSICAKKYDLFRGNADIAISTTLTLYDRDKWVTDPSLPSFQMDIPINDSAPRVAMLEQALRSTAIFSLSVVPLDPTQFQTWYVKRNYSTTFEDTSGDGSCSIAQNVSNEKSDKDSPPPILTGFVQPFPKFDSDLAAPEVDPSSPEFDPILINNKEQIPNILRNTSPRNRYDVGMVLASFVKDVGAKAISLTLLEDQDRFRRIHFTKPTEKISN